MAERIRCPDCGALNPAEAQWCGQCHRSFAEPEPEPQPEPEPELEPERDAQAQEQPPDDPAPAQQLPDAAIGTQRGAFRVTEAGIVWTCAVCESENPVATSVCEVCGALLAETVRPKVERPERDPGTAALYSLFLPGAGHAYIGMWGQAVARFVLSAWAFFVIIVSVASKESGSNLIAVVFAVVATGLWVTTAHDAYREAQNQPQATLLKGRVFLWTVLGLLLLLMVMLTVTGLSARG